ncbi:MAG TPA: TetR/AcrR family transcriptional regulator [Mycobacteriales bacterium]|jgi:AcrR family transcriptional regulator|nr:TetR/AcrR family transcriptional regulator [Mycobacteriales bacterium]
MTRRRLSIADRRQELIAAALELFSARPAAEVTLDDVAAQAGVSRALAYRYFGGRNEIYVAAMRTAADQMLALLDPPHDAPPLDRLVEAIRRFFDFAEEHATGFQALLTGHPGAQDGAIGSIVDEVRAALHDRLVEGMGLRKVSPEARLALSTWIAAAEAAAADWLTHRDLPRRTVEDFLLSQLYAALSVTAIRDREVARFMEGLQ